MWFLLTMHSGKLGIFQQSSLIRILFMMLIQNFFEIYILVSSFVAFVQFEKTLEIKRTEKLGCATVEKYSQLHFELLLQLQTTGCGALQQRYGGVNRHPSFKPHEILFYKKFS